MSLLGDDARPVREVGTRKDCAEWKTDIDKVHEWTMTEYAIHCKVLPYSGNGEK